MLDLKLAARRQPNEQSVISLNHGVTVGGQELFIAAGPCTVESHEQIELCAATLSGSGVNSLRGGVFKPRTSPYSFQGMGVAGAELLAGAGAAHELPVVSEVMSCDQIAPLLPHVDMLQVGSRNMQNFELLKALGRVGKPILLKRGLSATLEEFLFAAEYILSEGNEDVILCERGIRSFDTFTRNVLDLGAVVALKQLTHLPVIVDPSHAAGKSELVDPLARAAIACGADGLIIECHPRPRESVSDARQALSLPEMISLVENLRPIAAASGRTISAHPPRPASAPSVEARAHALVGSFAG